MNPTDRILQALREQGKCSRGDLYDAAGCKSYPELDALLNPLIQQSLVEPDWHESGFRCYRLAAAERPRHTTPAWLQAKK